MKLETRKRAGRLMLLSEHAQTDGQLGNIMPLASSIGWADA